MGGGEGTTNVLGENGLGGVGSSLSQGYPLYIGDSYYGGQRLDEGNKKTLLLSYPGLSEVDIKDFESKWASNFGDRGGYGGKGGQGGKVEVSKDVTLLCYNGNAITDGVSDSITIASNDGGFGNKVLSSIELPDGSKIVPAFIYAQAGYIRADRIYNSYFPTEYSDIDFEELEFSDYRNEDINIEVITVKNENTTPKLDYKGPFENQGIGSGAGRIEVSNGTFEKID